MYMCCMSQCVHVTSASLSSAVLFNNKCDDNLCSFNLAN